jgi:hypothetical protein
MSEDYGAEVAKLERLPPLTLGMILTAKSRSLEWNPERLSVLFGRSLQELERIDEAFARRACLQD